MTTEDWARSLKVSVAATPPTVENYAEPCPRTARDIAVRTVILQGLVAVAAQVEPEPIIEWFQDQQIWSSVTPEEQAFLQSNSRTQEQCHKISWHIEAEWTLLWVIGLVESLGLPTHACDSRRMCDEIMPELGSDIEDFLSSAEIRSPGILLAENDRTYDLWCYANIARSKRQPLPVDLNWGVLYERRYAFEWLDGMQDWDDVTCDA